MDTRDFGEEEILHREKLNIRKIKVITWISFLLGFAEAFFIYIMSSYLKLSSGIENVGVFYLVSYSIILIIYLNLHKIVKRFGKTDVFHFSLLGKIITIVFLLLVSPGIFAIALIILFIIFSSLEWASLDVILESYSNDRMSGRIRGKFLTVINTGFLAGPFLSTWILERYDYHGIFLLLLVFSLIGLAISIWGIKKTNHHFSADLTVKDVLKKVIVRKNIRKIFYISFVLEFFYALMVIYTPIYLIDLGISWDKIGIIFTAMLLPFVILQYPAGILADKKFGEKEFLIFAIAIMGLSTLAAYFISGKSILIWSVILFSTRIGAALVEVLRDSYFYKRIDGYDVDIINIFRTAKPLAFICASVISAIILLFLPIKIIFIAVGLIVLSALWPAIRLKDSQCEKEMGIKA